MCVKIQLHDMDLQRVHVNLGHLRLFYTDSPARCTYAGGNDRNARTLRRSRRECAKRQHFAQIKVGRHNMPIPCADPDGNAHHATNLRMSKRECATRTHLAQIQANMGEMLILCAGSGMAERPPFAHIKTQTAEMTAHCADPSARAKRPTPAPHGRRARPSRQHLSGGGARAA